MLPYYLIFAASGFAALVYEVSWNRQLGLLFGHTSHAAAAVLAAYFGGMAIGYAIGGRWAHRVCPFRGYAACEIVAGLWAITVPFLISHSAGSLIEPLLHSRVSVIQMGSRVVFSLLLLAPATIALGATLPIMNEIFRQMQLSDGVAPRDRLTRAYGWNVLGAVGGVLAASSLLLPIVGVTRSSGVAAMISLACAAAALMLRRVTRLRTAGTSGDGMTGSGSRQDFRESQNSSKLMTSSATSAMAPANLGENAVEKSLPKRPGNLDKSERRFWSMVVVVSGAATLAMEVLYTRLFSLVFHNSTYTFSFVLIGFLLGLSLSAMVASRLLVSFSPKTIVTWAGCLAAAAIAISVVAFVTGTRLLYFQAGETFAAYYANGLLLVLAITLPVAFFTGLILPTAWFALSVQAETHSHEVGRLTLANTVAAAVGAIIASFVLFPALGLWKSFAVVALAMLAPAFWQLHSDATRMRILTPVVVAVLACLPLLIGNPESWVRGEDQDTLLRRLHSTYGWIDVVQNPRTGAKKVRQNLHYRFGATGESAEREYRQAHLPLLLHPQPRDVALLGLGTGMTAGGAVPHRELQSIDIVELIPEVVDAVRLLGDENRHVVDDPRTTMIVDDARHFLATTERKYDVIVSDLFVPWESETGYLYTVEQFAAAKKRLRPQGLLCQWLPLYQLGVDDFEMIADSLRSVFPHVTLWWGRLSRSRPIVGLVASESPLQINEIALDERLRELLAGGHFQDTSLATATRLFELYAGDWPQREGARLNTDEHPWVEFHSPVSHRSRSLMRGAALHRFLKRFQETSTTDSIKYIGATGSSPPSDRSWQHAVMFPEPNSN
ncbi:fused MFS/spermidine synthase [Novipirellula rosea]|uniref:Fused MFS/spermidine synthase n=2 Tax=Novipirellula rosea TaxID=1031540 RepID=A0ABP8NNQ2_9BACT